MTESEESVVDFYRPVLEPCPVEVQRLVMQLLRGKFKHTVELEEAIMAVVQTTADEQDNA
ncbi:hypothetical protein [Candidatus Poriferisodalis sp.]|uniref:hypothetical protein n=1 Tax=Candidatus Poriferisodalis sp. TaxID=3101277 RepID=UPI003B0144FC